MKHAVVLAHPKPDSFNASVAAAYADAARALGHTVVLRDLYALDFDPRLKASELPSPHGYGAAPDAAAERELLRDVDVFCLVYPFWFNAPPAILKGYVDRVLSMDFGYRFEGSQSTPGLIGRQLISLSTSGAPDRWIAHTHALNTLIEHFDMHLTEVTGLTFADHLHFGSVLGDLSPEDAEDIFAQVRSAVGKLAEAG